MKKVAVIIAPGFEEGEALTIVDILRRGQIQCDTIALKKKFKEDMKLSYDVIFF